MVLQLLVVAGIRCYKCSNLLLVTLCNEPLWQRSDAVSDPNLQGGRGERLTTAHSPGAAVQLSVNTLCPITSCKLGVIDLSDLAIPAVAELALRRCAW